ncbi:MAG: hypothetical protein ABJQ39_05880 [Winogradskyella arenosi]
MQHFSPNGDLLATELKPTTSDPNTDIRLEYNHNGMYNWYFELLNIEMAGTSENHLNQFIWNWFWYIFDNNPTEYFKIINTLLGHPNEKVLKFIAQIIALHRFQPYIPECQTNSKVYKFIRAFTSDLDEKFPERRTKIVNLNP